MASTRQGRRALRLVAASLAVGLLSWTPGHATPTTGSAAPRAEVEAAWSTTGPSPALVTALEWHPTVSGTVYAGTSNGAVLRSGDSGATWSVLATVSDDRVADIAVRGNTVMAALASSTGAGGGVARSLDGGVTWQVSAAAQGITNHLSTQIDISPANADIALLGTNNGLFRTTNAGATWTAVPVPTGTQVYDVLFDPDPARATVAYAASNTGVARSTTTGASFTAFAGGASSASTYHLTRVGSWLYASGFGVLVRTDVAAAAWASAATGLTLGATSLGRVVDLGTALLLPDAATLRRTPMSPIGWVAAPVQPPFPLSLLEVDPTQPLRVLGLGDGALARTTDGGSTWAPVPLLTPPARTATVAPTSAGSALVNAEPGLVRTGDRGQSFVTAETGLPAGPAIDRPGPAVAAGDPSRVAMFVTQSQVYLSTDGGLTWSARTYGISNYDGVLAFAPSDPTRVYGAGFTGAVGAIRRSTNGGDSWAAGNSTGASFTFANGLAVDVTDPLLVYLSTSSGLRVSTDGGDTWAIGGTGLPAGATEEVVTDPVTPGTAHLVADGRLWRSTDRGTTWAPLTALPSGSPRDLVVHPAAPTTIWAGTETGVFRSLDGGATWAAFATGLPSPRVNDLAIDRDLTVLYAATDRGLAVTSLVDPTTTTPAPTPSEPPTATPPAADPPAIGPTAAPSRPLRPKAVVKRGKVILTWRAPVSGVPLTGYVVQAKPKGKKKATFRSLATKVSPEATRYVWRKPKPGRTYLLRVAARNAVGRGPFSAAVSARVR